MNSENYFALIDEDDPIKDEERFHKDIYLHAAAWGWNANHRCGHLTATALDEPHHVQRSKKRNYIAAAAGKHHSLLVSDRGVVYTFGDGRKGQLGYGNIFTGEAVKGGVVQATPQPITPTGELRLGTDIQCIQVGGGTSFSIAREATPEEGAKRVVGFLPLEQKMKLKRILYPESYAVQKAWARVRTERYAINRTSQGQIIAWGEGKKGELGLGEEEEGGITYSPFPKPLKSLSHTVITQISTGPHHTVCVDKNGYAYSWGWGVCGRLGHGDYNDRHTPTFIKFFASMIVTFCAAGDAHSAVLTIGRGVPGAQTPRILTFGRGAHGRLGNGTNRTINTPTLISPLPPSLEDAGVELVQVVCGGAHTMALGRVRVKKQNSSEEILGDEGLVYPFGERTFVVAWGYGANGQLGNGGRADAFTPMLVRLPKAEIVAEIAAGRSWSMARTIGGQVYTWGKGLRGQLGQGPEHAFSLSPRPLITYMSVLKLSGGYAHSLALFTSHQILSTEKVEAVYTQKRVYSVKEQQLLVNNRIYNKRRLLTEAAEKRALDDKGVLPAESKFDYNRTYNASLTDIKRIYPGGERVVGGVAGMTEELGKEGGGGERLDVLTYTNNRFLGLSPLRPRALYEINCCHRDSTNSSTANNTPNKPANNTTTNNATASNTDTALSSLSQIASPITSPGGGRAKSPLSALSRLAPSAPPASSPMRKRPANTTNTQPQLLQPPPHPNPLPCLDDRRLDCLTCQVRFCCYYCALVCHSGHTLRFSELKHQKVKSKVDDTNKVTSIKESEAKGEGSLGDMLKKKSGGFREKKRSSASSSSSPSPSRQHSSPRRSVVLIQGPGGEKVLGKGGKPEEVEIKNPLNVDLSSSYPNDLLPLPNLLLFPRLLIEPLPVNMKNHKDVFQVVEESKHPVKKEVDMKKRNIIELHVFSCVSRVLPPLLPHLLKELKYMEKRPKSKPDFYEPFMQRLDKLTEFYQAERKKRGEGKKKKKGGVSGASFLRSSGMMGGLLNASGFGDGGSSLGDGMGSLPSSLLPPMINTSVLPYSMSITSADNGGRSPQRGNFLGGITPSHTRPTSPVADTANQTSEPSNVVVINPFSLGGRKRGQGKEGNTAGCLIPTCHCSLFCGGEGEGVAGGKGLWLRGGSCRIPPNIPENIFGEKFEANDEDDGLKGKDKKLRKPQPSSSALVNRKAAPSFLGGISFKLPALPSFNRKGSGGFGLGGMFGANKKEEEVSSREPYVGMASRLQEDTAVSEALSNTFSSVESVQRNIFNYYNGNARKIARFLRKVVTKRKYAALSQEMLKIRNQVVKAHVKMNIIMPVFDKFKRVYARYRENEEREEMEHEEQRTRLFNKYAQQQQAFMSLRVHMQGVMYMLMQGSIHYPVPKKQFLHLFDNKRVFSLLQKNISEKAISRKLDFMKTRLFSSEWSPSSYLSVPSFCFTLASLRYQQLLLHPSQRLPVSLLVKICRHYPIYLEGKGGEGSVCVGSEKYDIYDNYLSYLVKTRESMHNSLQKTRAHVQQVAQAASALSRLKAMGGPPPPGNGAVAGKGAPPPPTRVYKGSNLAAYKQHLLQLTKSAHRYQKRGYKNAFLEEQKVFLQYHNFHLGNYYIMHLLSIGVLGSTGKSLFTSESNVGMGGSSLTSHKSLFDDFLSLLQATPLPTTSSLTPTRLHLPAKLVFKYLPLMKEMVAASEVKSGGKSKSKSSGTRGDSREKKKDSKNKEKRSQTPEPATAYALPSTLSPILTPSSAEASNSSQPAPNSLLNARKRRHTIADPCALYARMAKVCLKTMPKNAFLKRRLSLPSNLSCLRKLEFSSNKTMRESVIESLSLYSLRESTIVTLRKEYEDFFTEREKDILKKIYPEKLADGSTAGSMTDDGSLLKKTKGISVKGGGSVGSNGSNDNARKDVLKARAKFLHQSYVKNVTSFAPFSPRYPPDITSLLLTPTRRRTIGEPERLYALLRSVTNTHTAFADVANLTSRYYLGGVGGGIGGGGIGFGVRAPDAKFDGEPEEEANAASSVFFTPPTRHKRSFDYGECFYDARGIMGDMDFGFDVYVNDGHVYDGDMYNKPVYADPYYAGTGGQGFYHTLVPASRAFKRHTDRIAPQVKEAQRTSQRIYQRLLSCGYVESVSKEIRQIARENQAARKAALFKLNALVRQDDFLREKDVDPSAQLKDAILALQSDNRAGAEGSVKAGGKAKKSGGRKAKKGGIKAMARAGKGRATNPFDDDTPSLPSKAEDDSEGFGEGDDETGEDGEGDSLSSLPSHPPPYPSYELTNYSGPATVVQTYYTEGGDAYYVSGGESYWALEDVPTNGGEVQLEIPFVDEYGNAYWFNNTTQQYRPMN